MAWDLVEHCRSTLTIAELNTVFVRLGLGEYSDAVEMVLKSRARTFGPPLPQELVVRLTRWAELRYLDHELGDYLAVLSRAGKHTTPRC